MVDIAQDGYLDIITVNIGEPNGVYFGDPEMKYSRNTVFDSNSNYSYSLDFGDWDRNGSSDIVFGNSEEAKMVF